MNPAILLLPPLIEAGKCAIKVGGWERASQFVAEGFTAWVPEFRCYGSPEISLLRAFFNPIAVTVKVCKDAGGTCIALVSGL